MTAPVARLPSPCAGSRISCCTRPPSGSKSSRARRAVTPTMRRWEGSSTEIPRFGGVSRAQLTQIGGTGVFVSGLRARLLDGDIDIAVHSLKDLPAVQPDQIEVGAGAARGR